MDSDLENEIILMILNHHQFIRSVIRRRRNRTRQLILQSRARLLMLERYSFHVLEFMMNSISPLAIMNVQPRMWTIGKKLRSSEWWDRDVLFFYDDQQWLEDFRMTKPTFFKLVDLVRDELCVEDGTFMPSNTVEKKVAVAVYKLATCGEYRAIGKGFGIHKSTVCTYVHAFCKALIKLHLKNFIKWPDENECRQISAEFEEKYNLPNIIGVIDGTHVPIKPPDEGAADFKNRKGFSSIAVQAVVDHRMLFRNITCRHPGCTHDAAVLRDSYLYYHHETMFPDLNREIDGILNGNNQPIIFKLPTYIIGDPAYPLLPWIMEDYPTKHNEEETSFNLYLNRARIIVEQAFGRLKGRWRAIRKKSDLDVYNMPHIIMACCILHNFVELNNQNYYNHWEINGDDDGQRQLADNHQVDNIQHDFDGGVMRDHLAAYVTRNFGIIQRYH